MSANVDESPDAELPLRPPWAVAEWAFSRLCDGCLACVQACREGILYRGENGLPEVDFQFGGCDFCAACLAACNTGALRQSSATQRKPFRYTLSIDGTCLTFAGEPCNNCAAFCDTSAIRIQRNGQGVATPVINLQQCNGCGACVGPCPLGNIRLSRPLPPEHG
jgi:ferredoxin-type protein NapF